MAKIKGCINDECEVHKKKIKYKESEEYCPECGMPLSYVCKKCHTPLDKKEKYCVIHQAEWEDRVDKVKKYGRDIVGAGLMLVSVAVAVAKDGKEIVEYITKK